jgi:amidase
MQSIGAASGIDPWELSTWDAVETAERIRRREVSAPEVIDAALRRAADMRSLNAIVTSTESLARAAAARTPNGPFFGVPTAIKDLAHVRGVRTASGTAASGTWIANRTSSVVRAFEELGFVSIGKSATPELGMTGTTEPIAFGPCRNPHAKEHSTGGSSGGAAALVASRVVPIAHGSDGGGSIRIPAACCGLVGLKPSRGRLDMEGSNLLPVNIAVDGVLTRTVRDTVAFWTALERHEKPRGIAPIGHVAKAPARRLKLAVFVDSPIETTVDPEVRAATERTAALCVELGHEVRPIPCPFGPQVVHDFLRLWTFVGFVQARAGRLLVHPRFERRKLEPFTHGFARDFVSKIPETFAAMRRLRGFAARYASIVAPYDALLGPTLGELPPKLGHLATDQDYATTIDRLFSFTPFTGLINAAGAPALSMPMGESASGLPIGVQLMGAHGAERVLLELASELELAR